MLICVLIGLIWTTHPQNEPTLVQKVDSEKEFMVE